MQLIEEIKKINKNLSAVTYWQAHELLQKFKAYSVDANDYPAVKTFWEYYSKTAILKDYYADQNKYFGVDGVGTIQDITERLSAVIDNL